MERVLNVLIALFGIILHAAGILLQKKGADGLDFKELADIRNIRKLKITRSLVLWVIGLLVAYEISVIPTGIASRVLQPQVISAISGFAIVIIVVFSHYFLKEKIYPSDVAYSVVIVGSIFGVCLLQLPAGAAEISIWPLFILTVLPFLLLPLLPLKQINNKVKAMLLGSFSGLTGGITIVMINVAVKQNPDSFSGLFASIYIYLFIVIGFISGFSMQAAYKFGNMIHIAPVQVSLSVVYPLICAHFVFNQSISLLQDLFIFIIGLCCWVITRKH